MLAEIYLLQLELAAQDSEKRALTPSYEFVPFSPDAFAVDRATQAAKRSEHAMPR